MTTTASSSAAQTPLAPAPGGEGGLAPGRPILSARAVVKSYHLGRVTVPVLRGVDLDVAKAECVAILGASGSGKSTLLHLLGGLDRLDSGTIAFEGRALQGPGGLGAGQLDAYRRSSVGFVFQFYHLLPELTVVENVALAAMILKGRAFAAQRTALLERAESLLKEMGLGSRLKHRPVELSGGERQRVAIARALMNAPPVLLADEPTGNLDHASGQKILDILFELRRKSNLTMVLVTHDREVAARADRIVQLVDGQVAGR